MKALIFPLWLAGTCLFAAPINTQHISADAKWVAHVNMEALMESKSHKVLMDFMSSDEFKENFSSTPFNASKFEDGKKKLEKVRSMTLYGSTMGKGEGVAIVDGDLDIDDLTDNVFGNKTQKKTIQIDGYSVHSWKGHKRHKEVLMTAFNSDTHVFATSLEKMTDALDVLGGHKTDLQQSKNELKSKLSAIEPAFILAVVGKTPQLKRSMIMKKSKSLVYTFTENDGEAKSLMTMELNNEQEATQVQAIMYGFKAFAGMSAAKFPGVSELLERYQITQKGTFIDLDLSFTPEEMSDWLKVVSKNIPSMMNKRSNCWK